MNPAERNLSFSRSFREGMGEFLELRNLAILVAVPVVVALIALVEGRLEMRGVIGPYSRNQSLRMLLWNVTVVVSYVAVVRGSLSLGRIWRFSRPVRGAPGDLLGALASLFMTFFGVMCVMGAAVMLASDGMNLSGLLFLVGWCTPVLFWTVCLAALMSMLADGPGAAWLGATVFHLSLVPGLFGRGVSHWVLPPVGRLVSATVNGSFFPGMLLAHLLHSMALILLGLLVFRFRSSRNWQ